MIRTCLLLLLAVSSGAGAVVIRDDVDDARYRVPASEFPALADMPGEGHGVLITPQWVITAAHVLPRHHALEQVVINGKARAVERVVVHPGYAGLPEALAEQAVATGEWMLAVVQIASSDDIALVRLKHPVTDVTPVALHVHGDELGRTVEILGKGATGTGVAGQDPDGSHRTVLRRAFNTVTSAHERWFCYVFDAPASALPLEGKTGSGDSGGPVLVQVEGQRRLAGLASWGFIHGDVRTVRAGRYGQFTCNVRLSHYAHWIKGVTSER